MSAANCKGGKAVGKRGGWSTGAGPAEQPSINLFQAPILATRCSSAYIETRASQLGALRALVDSGAVNSAVRYDLIAQTELAIKQTSTRWVCADGFADGVVGVVGLTVSYQNRVVRLPEVVVFKTLQVPFLLGMDWIDAAKVAVMTEDHKGVVYLRDSKGDVIREQTWPTFQLIPASEDKPAITKPPMEVFKSLVLGSFISSRTRCEQRN